jgi:hypothetical protein
MRGERRLTCNAVENNIFLANKIVYYYEIPSQYFVDFYHFSRFLKRLLRS